MLTTFQKIELECRKNKCISTYTKNIKNKQKSKSYSKFILIGSSLFALFMLSIFSFSCGQESRNFCNSLAYTCKVVPALYAGTENSSPSDAIFTCDHNYRKIQLQKKKLLIHVKFHNVKKCCTKLIFNQIFKKNKDFCEDSVSRQCFKANL